MTGRQGTGLRAQGTGKDQGTGLRAQGSVRVRARTAWAVLAAATVLAAGHARAASAETVKLDAQKAAARVVEVSHAAAAAGARVGAAAESVKSADAAALPSLAAGASVARRSSVPEFRLPIALPGLPSLVLFPDITTTYDANLQLQQALYTGGALTGRRQAARHDGAAAMAARTQTDADLRLAAQVAYWEAVRTSASVDVARAQRQRAERLLDDTKALLAAGMAVRADELAAQARAATAQVQVIDAEAAAGNALTQLRSLLHIEPSDGIELADSLAGPIPPPAGAAEELQALATSKRPELAASAAQIEALRSRELVARAEARPSVGAVALWDYSRPNQRYFPLSDQWKSSWSVGLVASWTLFDGGRARADTAASRLTRRAASEDRLELERRIRAEVETDRRNLESARAAVAAADAAHDAAVGREQDARERHAAGLAPMVEVLDAEAQLADAEQQQVNARAASWIAAALLARAVGQ